MRFCLFERAEDAHIRKSREYLEDAKVKRVEHEAAAEHHGALSKMYSERIARVEAEINAALQSNFAPSIDDDTSKSIRLKSDSVLIYPSRVTHASGAERLDRA